MEGVYAYSESMAFKYASGFTVGQTVSYTHLSESEKLLRPVL